jgi:aspartate aminotransferase
MERLVLGDSHPALVTGRVMTLQTPGGCGALRLVADLHRP